MGFAPALRRCSDAIAECTANRVAMIGYAETESRWFSDTLARYRISRSVLCTGLPNANAALVWLAAHIVIHRHDVVGTHCTSAFFLGLILSIGVFALVDHGFAIRLVRLEIVRRPRLDGLPAR